MTDVRNLKGIVIKERSMDRDLGGMQDDDGYEKEPLNDEVELDPDGGIVVQGPPSKRTFLPEFMGLLIEVAFCLTVTSWDRANDRIMSRPEGIGDTNGVILGFWITFVSFIVIRLAIYANWVAKEGTTKIPPSIWAGLFMLCSTIQFVIYMALFYMLWDRWCYVGAPHAHIDFTNVLDESQSSAPGADHAYDTTCRPHAPDCDGMSMLGMQRCCVFEIFTVRLPTQMIPWSLGLLTIWPAFEVLKWLCILAMSWVWKDVPFIKMTAADMDFLNTVWLTILDSTVFGSTYTLAWDVVNPRHGIGPDGRAQEAQDSYSTMIWYVWMIGSVSSLLVPALYIMFGFLDVGDDSADQSLDNATCKLMRSIQMLDNEGAKELADEAIRLQIQVYDEADGDTEEHPVVLKTEDGAVRRGVAMMSQARRDVYLVKFDDGEEEEVEVANLEPTFTRQSNSCTSPNCCKGWLDSAYLTPENTKDTWERRCNYFNTLRELIFIEAPYGCIRFYFDIWLGGWPTIMLLKNIVWGVIDVLLLLSCGNEKATCMMYTPIEFVRHMVKGSKMAAIWIGPAGMFRIGADMAQQAAADIMEAKKDRLIVHKAWLVLQREKVEGLGRNTGEDVAEALQSFDTAIGKVEEAIGDLEAQQTFIHE